ncbi:MAG: CARDB domain-containing protein [Methermicoccaceae archaeon]
MDPPSTPQEDWNRTFGERFDDNVRALFSTADGGFMLAGENTIPYRGQKGALVKYDASGNLQWNKTYGNASIIIGDDSYAASQYVYDAQKTSDGGYILVGDFLSGPCDSYGLNRESLWLAKTDANGTEQWNRTYCGDAFEYRGTETHFVDAGRAVSQTSDGGYIVAVERLGMGISQETMLVKISSGGRFQWNVSLNTSTIKYATDITTMADGGYLVVGYVGVSGKSYDGCLVKTDAAGAVQWNKTYGGSGYDYFHALAKTSDGGYALAGSLSDDGEYKGWLLKTDASGTEELNVSYSSGRFNPMYNLSGWGYFYALQQTSDGGYVLAGCSGVYGEPTNAWVLRADLEGKRLWNSSFGGDKTDRLYAVRQLSQDSYAVAGNTESYAVPYSAHTTYPDMWLVKLSCSAQHPRPVEHWNATYGESEWDAASDVLRNADGGYMLAGYTSSYGSGEKDGWVVKTCPNGTEQHSIAHGGSKDDVFYSAAYTADGGYMLAGYTSSYGSGEKDGWVVKTDANGTEQWNRTFGARRDDSFRSIRQSMDGGYVLAGYTTSDYPFIRSAWLVKIDPLGNEQWSRVYGGGSTDAFNDVWVCSDGGYALAGYTQSYGAGSSDAWLLKTDSHGYEQWNRTYGHGSSEIAHAVIQTEEGGYALAGNTTSYGAGSSDAWLLKTNGSGVEAWNRTFGGGGTDSAVAIGQNIDGGYALVGQTDTYGNGSLDGWLIRTSANGTEVWNITYGGETNDSFNAFQPVGDGLALAGYTTSYGAGSSDAWLVKVGTPLPAEGPDLAVHLTLPPSAYPGALLRIAGYVSNEGIAAADACRMAIFFNGTPVGFLSVPHLAAGQSHLFGFNSYTYSTGLLNITAIVDCYHEVDDVNPANNICTAQVNVWQGSVCVPEEEWNRTYGQGSWDEAFTLLDEGDGYVLAGCTGSYGADSMDGWLFGTNSTGGLLWNFSYGGAGSNKFNSVVSANDGYVLAGYTTAYGAGSSDAWLLKAYSNGSEAWNWTFGAALEEKAGEYASTLTKAHDGGFVMAGWTTSFGAHSKDGMLVKTDASGNEQWMRTFGGNSSDVLNAVQRTPDSGYVLAGYTSSYGAGERDAWLIKTDASGYEQWSCTFGGNSTDEASAVLAAPDGGYVLAGITSSYGNGSLDGWFVKTHPNGTEMWNRTFGGLAQDGVVDISPTEDGGYVLAGYTASYGAGGDDAWLIRTDFAGTEVWNLTYGNISSDRANTAMQTSDGGYALAGYTASYGAGSCDAWLLKLACHIEHPVPNLVVNLVQPARGALGVPMTIAGSVLNTGNGTASASTLMLLANGTPMHNISVPSLNAPGYYQFTFDYTPNSSGTLNITAIADYCADVNESNETDNQTSVYVNVSSTAPKKAQHLLRQQVNNAHFNAHFDASGIAGHALVNTWTWDFGDGVQVVLHTPIAAHQYDSYVWNGSGYEPFVATLIVDYSNASSDSFYAEVLVFMAGDANGDGVANILDAALVGLHWNACYGSVEYHDGADLNNDDVVNILDAALVGLGWNERA